MLGVYAVVAYAVQQRTREIAIRSALGATPRVLLGVFLRQSAPVVVMGCAFGTLGALGVGRVLASQLYGVAPFDPATMVAGCALIGFGALTFTWAPARRAATISPSIALNDS
jgi:putative ABC transport system permease protein